MKRGDKNKHDAGKPMWDLVPLEQIEKIAVVLTFGAGKYSANSWQNVDKERYVAALLRHIVKYRSGEKIDSDSGLTHLAHALTNLTFLAWFEDKEAE